MSVKTEPVKDNGGRLKQEMNGIQSERDSTACVDRLFTSSRTNSKNTATSTDSSSNYETGDTYFNPYKPSVLIVGYANSADPDQTPQSVASDQGLHCLLTECSIKIRIKMKNTTQQPLKRKWTGPIYKEWEIPLGLNGLTINC